MKQVTSTLALMSALAGAGGAYFLDPRLGRRRRARVRDMIDHATHEASRGAQSAMRDLEQRAHGLASQVRGAPSPHAAHATDDAAIVARVRSRLGHVCTHPHALVVACQDGLVELGGPILAADVQDVLRVVWATVGVRDIVDRLERHTSAEGIPGLSGPPRRGRGRNGFWAPGTRLLVGTGGALSIVFGVGRGGISGTGAAIAGSVALVRALGNIPLGGLVGLGERPILEITKATTIHVPVEHVFAFFENPDNFPKFMQHVEDVRQIGDKQWQWTMRGIVHDVSAKLESVGTNATRVTLRLAYAPPGGILGHEVARLFGADPKHELDDDMLRLKSLLEQGKTTGRSGVVTLEEVRRT